MELRVDPERVGKYWQTGMFVRAKLNDHWGSHDIIDLDKESLLTWLRSRGGDNPWAEDVVGILFEHGHLHELKEVKRD